MADEEIDSFVKKFKSLWAAGHQASLSFESKVGEVCVNLSCNFGRNLPPPVYYVEKDCKKYHKNVSPSRERRRARRFAERAKEVNLREDFINDNSVEESVAEDVIKNSCIEDGVCAEEDILSHENLILGSKNEGDVAETNVNITTVTTEEDATLKTTGMTNSVAIIPLEKVTMNDDKIRKNISEKLELNSCKVGCITIHRDASDNSFVRGDVSIELMSVSQIKDTNFGFETCVVLPCQQKIQENG